MKFRAPAPILLILLIAAVLRFAGITFDSLWLDEGYQTMIESTGQAAPDFLNAEHKPFLFKFTHAEPLNVVLANFTDVDPLCPPLYAVMLNRWMTAFGTGDFAVRSLSALLSIAGIAGTFIIANSFFGRQAALIAAALHAVSPFDIHYGQEARMYALALFSAIVSCGSLSWLLFARAKLRWLFAAIYAVSTCALINSHYTGLFTLAFQGLFSLWYCCWYREWRRLIWLGGSWLGVLLLWMPWFDIFRHAAGNRTASFYVVRKASIWWPFYALFVRIPVNWLTFLSGKHVVAWALPVYATSAALVASAVAYTRQAFSSRVAFFWAWAIVPAFLLWIIDVAESRKVVEISRYTMTTAPAIYILCGIGAYWLVSKRRWFAALLVVHILFAGANVMGTHALEQREPWKLMAATVERECSPEDLILVSQYYNIACLDRYLTKPFIQIGISPALGEEHFHGVVRGRDQFWLLTAQEGESIKSMVPDTYELDRQFDFRHGLHLRRYKLIK